MDFSKIYQKQYHKDLCDELVKSGKIVLSGIGNTTAKAFLASDCFAQHSAKKIVWIAEDLEEVQEIKKDLCVWYTHKVFIFSDFSTEQEQNTCLVQFYENKEQSILLLDAKLAEKKFPLFSGLKKQSQEFSVNQICDEYELLEKLKQLGYQRSEETVLKKAEFKRVGDVLEIHPISDANIYRVELAFDAISRIYPFEPLEKTEGKNQKALNLFANHFCKEQRDLVTCMEELDQDALFVIDEADDFADAHVKISLPFIQFTSFPRDDVPYHHLRYLSVLKFYTLVDLFNDLRNKIQDKWMVCIYSKRTEELESILNEEKISFSFDLSDSVRIKLIQEEAEEYVPSSFQNPAKKIAFFTDREIFSLKKSQRNQSIEKLAINFIASLKKDDYVVHFDHGIGLFQGITQRNIQDVTREYLEIDYAKNDKLFIPIDQADKVSRYIVEDGMTATLSKLGGPEWQSQVRKAKKETEALAKDLLKLYAKRDQAKRKGFTIAEKDEEFASKFPYELTAGQRQSIQEVFADMESGKPMDRLLCGDVGFGKTEVAMRAAFKAVQNGKQVAVISPITILTEQLFLTFKKRMEDFNIRIEMMSRFKTIAEQKIVLEKMRKGDVDIVIGTHRLLQQDIEFLNLGLLVIDEEQRFGVKQKETLKELRSEIDILTMSATPIPRTLNLAMNKLRDISTITTPPPGRLPIITEVRRYSDALVRDAVLKELERGGQTYFLHNRVETIQGMAQKFEVLIPEARFIVAHGQLPAKELEERILAFKRGEYDVLISSTIIENGIDLANANTMIINNAEKFGVSQLYQLRGRVGRSNKQAYAYLLHHARTLKNDAKKRLRALVEATELGAGFQIAMRDLEIRGAGEILGGSQHGTMKTVGVSHFLKMLQKTIRDLKDGRKFDDSTETQSSDITIDLPIDAFIPNDYIPDAREKISVYQKLASVQKMELLQEFKDDLKDEYGKIPDQLENLFKILRLKIFARSAHLEKIQARALGLAGKEIQLILKPSCKPERIMKALEINPKWLISGNSLKLDMKELGGMWFEKLTETVEAMGK